MNSELLKMPKIELHLHMDGSIPIYVLEKLSGLTYEELYEKTVSINDISLSTYLERFTFINSFIKSKEDLIMVSEALGKELDKENVIYAEIRFAPLDYVNETVTEDDVIESVLFGLSKCQVKTNLILCMRRGMDYDYNRRVVDLANKYLNKGVVALDLVGDEEGYPFTLYHGLFDEIKALNIPITIHAGETTKRDVLDVIPYTKRIGHGIKIENDDELIKLIKENNILLEVCPNSNLDTRNAIDYSHHPIRKLYDDGVKVSVNTDNRTVSNISLTEEYSSLMNFLNFTMDDLSKMNLNAVDYAFITSEEKEELRKKIKNLD